MLTLFVIPTLCIIYSREQHAGQDAIVLANRIALLKKEEAKAWKKIQATKKRAEEILKMREENEAAVRERAAATDQNISAKQAKNHSIEEGMRLNREKVLVELDERRREGVAAVRQEKQVRHFLTAITTRGTVASYTAVSAHCQCAVIVCASYHMIITSLS
jgi:hypothetical protein